MFNTAALVADLPLPPLREDLRLGEAAAGPGGEPGWVIQDTVVNRFYRIGWFEFECLLRWGQSPRRISEQIASQTALKPDVDQVLAFQQFLEQHQLLRPGPQAVEKLRERSEGNPWLSWKSWLHHYLFFRIPLVRPQRLLERMLAHLGWLFHPFMAWLVLVLGGLGLVLVAHQWDAFKSAVLDSFSAEGALGFALALVVGKTLDPNWRTGQWAGTKEPLGVLYDPGSWQVDAYVKPDELHRISVGAQVRFYPEGQVQPIEGKVLAIGGTRVAQLDHPMLASRHGGPLATSRLGEALVPTPAVFHVLVQLDEAPPARQETRGQLQIDGARVSPLVQGATQVLAVLRLESGF